MREGPRRTLTARWLIALFAAALLVCGLAPVRAWAAEITVGSGEGSSYSDLEAAYKAASEGDTLKLTSDLTASKLLLINGKSVTIDGGGHSVTRAEDFTPTNDEGRGGYNPAMIEVANGATLTLTNITLNDNFLTEGTKFDLAGNSETDNSGKVQDGIIASYGDGKATIVLGSGTTLKNFGGLSAVYITGEGGKGATLIMKSDSKICDDTIGSREGGYGAIFNHGGTVQAENGSSIEDVDGRAIYADNAGMTTFAGTIKNITSSEAVKSGAEDAGVAYYGSGSTMFTLASGGVIEGINSHDDTGADSALHLIDCTFKTEQGSEVRNIEIVGIADMNGATVDLAGSITNCNAKDVLFRMRGTQGTFTLEESGSIKNCTCTDAMVYLNGGKPTITIAGIIDGVNKPALYMSSNGARKDGTITLTETGVITNVTGYGMRLEDPSHVTIAGTITNCSNYALQYYPKSNQSLLTIKSTATIENNNGGKAQVRAQNTLPATDAQEHIVIEPGGLDGNTTVDLTAFDVTLDADYESIKLGNAASAAASAIKEGVEKEHADWKLVGSAAIWLQPSASEVHFTVPRSYSMKKTALFAALIPLNDDGTPVADAGVILQEVKGADTVDVTLTGLTADQSYAMMFVNNNEYTLTADDITIYIGGGQGNENYDDGFPAVTINNSVDFALLSDDLSSLEIDNVEMSKEDGRLIDQLIANLEPTYTYKGEAEPAEDDSRPGEYAVTLEWKNGLTNADVRVNGNNVNLDGEGTLIVRYVENVAGATSGDATHELLEAEPAAPVEHAEAIAPSGSKFYTNDDTDREVSAEGVQLLDDKLLSDEDGTDRQALLEQKAEETEGVLPALDDGEEYSYQFHYLDLVDAFNGNAWVSASYGTTVYLPYPEGVTADTAEDLGVTVVHFKDLHREYGIAGQADVEAAIAVCELETMEIEYDANGIKFDVEREGFSPFAVVWTVPATYAVTYTDGVDDAEVFADQVTDGLHYGDDTPAFNGTPTRSGYTFTGWKPEVTETVTGDATYVAQWEKNSVTPPVTKYYEIDASAGEGGSISPSGTVRVKAGTSQSFSITPAEGYSIHAVYVDGEFCGRVSSYTFTNVQADHEISVQFKRGNDPADPGDTGVDQWFDVTNHDAFMHGYDDGTGTFGPDDNMSRAHAAQMFYNMLKDKSYGDIEISFPDVDEDEWYYEAVSVLASRGIIKGDDFTGTFRPADSISRAEFTAMAMRFSKGDYSGENIFVDVSEDAWYYDVVVGSVKYGWISGYQDGSHRFGPSDTLKRAQAATIANRMLGRVADSTWIVENLENDALKLFPDVARDHYAFFDIVEATNSHDYEKDNGYESWTGLK